MKKISLLLAMTIFTIGSIIAQRNITGTVTDNDGEPLIGASIIVKGTSTGTVTDIDGSYTLEVPSGSSVLMISYTGFNSQEISLGASNVLDVILEQGIALTEIVVSGQGSGIQRKRLSTQVDVIDAEAIDKLPANQLDQLLQSNAPGAQVRLSSGQPGTAAIIRTRGPISANSSATPVVIIDGIRVDNLNSNPELGINTGGADISALADIPVESIEKIEYIKGGAATTLYGADAANGVIQIITKKGRPGQQTAFFETRLGNIQAEEKWLRFDRTGEAIFEPGFSQEYKAGLSGGSEKFSYNVIGSLYKDDSFNDLNEQIRRSFNFGLTSNMTDKLSYTGSFSYTGFEYNLDYNANTSFSRFSAAEGGAFGNLDDFTDEDWEVFKQDLRDRGALTDITQRINRLVASNKLTYNILPSLTANLTVGVENRGSRQQEIGTNAFQIQIGSIPAGTTDQAYLNRSVRNVFTTSGDFNLRHEGRYNEFDFITIAGGNFFRTNDRQERLEGDQGVDGTSSVNNFSTRTSEDFLLENANYGIYFLENIGWRDLLFLEFGGRFDQNTNAGDDVGFQFLPKIGLTYNISDHDFYANSGISSVMNSLRIRANYGEATNFAQPFSQDRTFVLESFLGGPAFRFDNPGNRDLKSERVKTTEVGIDLGFFDYRLNLEATYYDATTVDALFTPDNIPSSGQLEQVTNIGEISNTGWEFAMRANIIRSGKHDLNINASYNYNENVVESSGGAAPFNVGGFLVIGTWVQEGQTLGFLRGTKAVENADGTFEFEQNAFLGNSFAPHFGSFGLNYSYGKFNFFATADYQFGGTNVDLSLLLRYIRGVETEGVVPEAIAGRPFFDLVQYFTDDSDFVKVRNIGASYDFGSILTDKLKNVRLGINMTNPFNWTAADFDPETTGSGVGNQNGFASGGFAYGTESLPRIIMGSLKFSF